VHGEGVSTIGALHEVEVVAVTVGFEDFAGVESHHLGLFAFLPDFALLVLGLLADVVDLVHEVHDVIHFELLFAAFARVAQPLRNQVVQTRNGFPEFIEHFLHDAFYFSPLDFAAAAFNSVLESRCDFLLLLVVHKYIGIYFTVETFKFGDVFVDGVVRGCNKAGDQENGECEDDYGLFVVGDHVVEVHDGQNVGNDLEKHEVEALDGLLDLVEQFGPLVGHLDMLAAGNRQELVLVERTVEAEVALHEDLVHSQGNHVHDGRHEEQLEGLLHAGRVVDEFDPTLDELSLAHTRHHDECSEREPQFLVVHQVEDHQDEDQTHQRLEHQLTELVVHLNLRQPHVDVDVVEQEVVDENRTGSLDPVVHLLAGFTQRVRVYRNRLREFAAGNV